MKLRSKIAEQIGEPELARLSVFQRHFLRLQFLVRQRECRWSANPVTSVVELNRSASLLLCASQFVGA